MPSLKPCPFCGGEACVETTGWMYDHVFWIQCMGCGAMSQLVDADDYKKPKTGNQLAAMAAMKWNRRVE